MVLNGFILGFIILGFNNRFASEGSIRPPHIHAQNSEENNFLMFLEILEFFLFYGIFVKA